MDVVGYDMAKRCADDVFAKAGFRPGEGRDQVGVVELHDCFAANEVGIFAILRFLQSKVGCIADYLCCIGTLQGGGCL